MLLSTNSAPSNTSEFKIQMHLHLHQQSKKGRLVNQNKAKRRVSKQNLSNYDYSVEYKEVKIP